LVQPAAGTDIGTAAADAMMRALQAMTPEQRERRLAELRNELQRRIGE